MQHTAGYYYLAFNRGVDRRYIIANDEDYHFLLRKIKAQLQKYSLTFIAYCLMPNHYHFFVRLYETISNLHRLTKTLWKGQSQTR